MTPGIIVMNIAVIIAITVIVLFAPGGWKYFSIALLFFIHFALSKEDGKP